MVHNFQIPKDGYCFEEHYQIVIYFIFHY